MPRPVLVAVATVAATVLVAPAAHAQRCSQVHRQDLAPAKHVRLVERPDGNGGTELVGCILPRGDVHFIAGRSAADDIESNDYTLLQVAREKVLVSISGGDQYGGGTATFVEDIRTEDAYTIVKTCYEILTGFCAAPTDSQPAVAAARINQIGQAAVLFTSSSGVGAVSFSTHGARTDRDSGDIDTKSLRLRGSTMSWTHGGEPRSATIDG